MDAAMVLAVSSVSNVVRKERGGGERDIWLKAARGLGIRH